LAGNPAPIPLRDSMQIKSPLTFRRRAKIFRDWSFDEEPCSC
jgi:hypothetical protein